MIRNGYCLLLINLLLLCNEQSSNIYGQDKPATNPPLIKLGVYTFPDRITKKYRSFLFNLEMERSFRKAPAFTQGPRLDYAYDKRATDNLALGYQLKLYPFWFFKRKPYNGLYVGGELTYNLKFHSYTIAGPGLAGHLGYQAIIKDRFIVGGEFRMSYVKNLNGDYPGPTPEHVYFFPALYLKLGLKLNARQ